jgi:NADH-quinone oxidoreductase subunit J
LLNLRGREDLTDHSPPISRFTKYLVSVLLFVELFSVVRSGLFRDAGVTGVVSAPVTGFGSVEAIAKLLFTRYLYPFELTSVLIVVAIVGAVVIAKRERGSSVPSGSSKIEQPSKMTTEEVRG